MNSDNEHLPIITTQAENEVEVEKGTPLPKCVFPKSFMLISSPGSRPSKPQNLVETLIPSQTNATSDGLKPIKYNDALQAIKRNVQNNSAKLTRSHPANIHPWASRRTGKKLLVLDLDQTICDCGPFRTDKVRIEERRPYLTKFLNAVYEYYDIVLWSATDKYIILDKIHRLKLFSERSKLLFHLDIDDMLKIKLPIKGKLTKTSVKPLETVWRRAQWYSSKNTLMIDDRSLNFLSNPKNGLQIKAYHRNDYITDNELLFLIPYLVGLAKNCTDFTTVNHKNWHVYKQTI